MKLFASLILGSASLVSGQILLFQDNFDAPDTNNLDLSDQTARRTGAVTTIQVRSSRIQHGIVGNQLNFLDNRTGRIRFHDDLDNDNTTAEVWHNWADSTTGQTILDGGGLRIEFDWIAGNDTSANWVSVNFGISGPGVAEPEFRVNHIETDIGMLFRYNGNTELFDNGTNLGAQGSVPPTIGTRHVVLDYFFDSFADGTSVALIASVDGTEVYNGSGFTLANNLGELYFEIGTLENTLLDNVAISAHEPDGYSIDLDNGTFLSGSPQGTAVGTLSATIAGGPDPSTFTLVSGFGDTDNDKFQINGDQLEIGTFDFTGANSTNGQEFSIRVQGTGTDTTERTLTFTVTKDDDLDNLLDDWELTWAPDLGVLSGILGTENADDDTLTDLEEFQLSQGTFPGFPAYPNINPTEADSDGDTLDDDEEINPVAPRVVTDPGSADTDLDGLNDFVENNTGNFVDANNTGTNPTLCDTDGDFARDSWEITYNTDPTDGGSHPGSVSSSVTIVPITDDASSDIDAAKTYTHAITGGNAATVNGVTFDVLSSTVTPANLLWDANGASFNEVVQNNGDWLPANGGVTGTEILTLLDSFTYSSTGAAPGSSQRYTLTGLTPGVNYDLRLYIRLWDTEGAARQIDLVFTNGTEVVQPYGALPEDRPGALTGTGNHHEAYYLNFNYTAQGTELVIDATINDCNPAVSGSYHLYGLTNEVTTGASGLTITDTTLTPAGQFVIAFQGRPSTTYQVTKSPDLATPFVALGTPLSVTTDFTGAGQAVIPAAETGDPKNFFRIE